MQLNSSDPPQGSFPGNCGNCGKKGHIKKYCPEKKVGNDGGGSGGGSGSGSDSTKKCNHCGRRGHLIDGCWKKNPNLAPQWIKDKLAKQKEVAGADVEIMMASIQLGVDVPSDFLSEVQDFA